MAGSPRAQKLREHEQRPSRPLRLDSVMSEDARRPGAGARKGMAVAETDLGLEDLAAAVAAEPRGPVTPSARGQPERPGPPAVARGGRRWIRWLVVAVPMAVAGVVGGYGIGSPTLWRDEAYT